MPERSVVPARIAELDEGQRSWMATWAREWITRGLATGPADRAAVEEAIEACYRLAGLRWLAGWVWIPSPLAGAQAAPLAAQFGRRSGYLVGRCSIGAAGS
jgi:hypothetical protein